MRHIARLSLTLTLCLLALQIHATRVWGQQNPPPTPNLLSLYPSGGQSGQTFTATITEQFQLEEASGLWFSHPGITAKSVIREADAYYDQPRPVPNQFEIQIAANTPPGVYEVRGLGRYGMTNARRFVVGQNKELLEEEKNNSLEEANELPIGATMNGKFAADYDYFRFSAKRGQTLMLSCSAWRIDSRGDAVLTVYDSAGRELDQMHDTAGADPVLDFTPPADGDYYVRVHELTYTSAGGRDAAPYRLTINSQPWIDYVEPPVISEKPTKVKVFGRNIGGVKSDRSRNGRPLEKLEITVTAAKLPAPNLLDMNCAPSEGAIEFRALHVATANGKSNSIPIAVMPGDATVEQEPNESIEQVTPLPLPIQINAKFDRPGDVDGYRFAAKKGESIWVEVHSQRLGQPTDVSFVVQRLTENATDKSWRASDVKTAADLPSPAGNFRLPFGSDDAALLFEAPADAEYRVLVRDDYGAAEQDVSLCYRLTVRKPKPTFRAVTAPGLVLASNRSNNRPIKPTRCVIQPGAAAEVLVVAYRSEGFEGEIIVRPESLPAGLSCDPLRMSGKQTMGALLLRAEPAAKPWTGRLSVVAEATIDGETVKRLAANVEVLWDSPRDNRSFNECRITTPLLVSIHDGLEHLGQLETPQREFKTARGGKVAIPLKFQRTFDKLTAALTVAAINPPDRVNAKTASVAAGKEAKVELDLLQDVKPGRYTLFLRGEGDIDFEREKQLFDRVTADQKRIATMAQQAARDYQTAASARRAADSKASQANSKHSSQRSAQQRAAAADRQAKQALAQAEAQAKKTPNDAASQALAATKKQAAATELALQKADEQLKLAEQQLAEAKAAQVKALDAEKQAKAHSDKGAQLKREADQALSRARTIARKVKVRLPVHSEVITLDVAAMPFVYVEPAEELQLTQGETREVKFALQRLFEFKGDVDLQISSAAGSRLRLTKAAKLAGGANQVQTSLSVDKNLAPGDYDAQWIVRTRFNNRSLEERLPLRVVVKPQAADAAANE